MMDAMDDLVQFLRARLDEDEQTARAATPGPWLDHGGYVTDVGPGGLPKVQVTDYGTQDEEGCGPQGLADSSHIARHDPARVLAEVDAKRRLLEAHKRDTTYSLSNCVTCDAGERSCGCMGGSPYDYPCETLRLLALPYADHPNYREEWRPDA